MPVARDFFQTFHALPLSGHPWVLVGFLANYIKEFKEEEPYSYLNSGVDIEELHSEIQDHFLRTAGTPEKHETFAAFKAYSELLFMFAFTVNQIQNGPVSNAHCKLARLLNDHDTVITFNWDTLMDRAMATERSWAVDWGYKVKPRAVFRDSWAPPHDPTEAGGAALLKLHGSANWLTGAFAYEEGKGVFLTQAAEPETLYVFESTTKPYDTWQGRYMDGHQPFSYGYYPPNLKDPGLAAEKGHVLLRMTFKWPWMQPPTAGDSGLVSMPMIIPPVRNKDYGMFGSLFGSIWKRAERALTAADHIVIIGYSFPHTDHRSVNLFTDAFIARNNVPRVTIIDPAPDRVYDMIVQTLGIPASNVSVHAEPFSEAFSVERALEF